MNHDDASSLLGAYALDALEGDEAMQVDEHLASCPRCRHELSGFREVTAALSSSAAKAPPELWERISRQLSSAPPPLKLVREPTSRSRWAARSRNVLAVAAAAAIAFLGWDVANLDAKVGNLQASLSTVGIAGLADSAALLPSSRRIELRSPSGSHWAEVVIEPSGQAFVVSDTLPELSGGRTYQLWGLSGTRPVSLGLLGPRPAPAAFRLDRSISALMVTAEPAGGVVAPTSAVLVKATLPTT